MDEPRRTPAEQLAYQQGMIDALGATVNMFRKVSESPGVITPGYAASMVEGLQNTAVKARENELRRQADE